MIIEDSSGIPYHIQEIKFIHSAFLIEAKSCNDKIIQFEPDSLIRTGVGLLQEGLSADQLQDAFITANQFIEDHKEIVYP